MPFSIVSTVEFEQVNILRGAFKWTMLEPISNSETYFISREPVLKRYFISENKMLFLPKRGKSSNYRPYIDLVDIDKLTAALKCFHRNVRLCSCWWFL